MVYNYVTKTVLTRENWRFSGQRAQDQFWIISTVALTVGDSPLDVLQGYVHTTGV